MEQEPPKPPTPPEGVLYGPPHPDDPAGGPVDLGPENPYATSPIETEPPVPEPVDVPEADAAATNVIEMRESASYKERLANPSPPRAPLGMDGRGVTSQPAGTVNPQTLFAEAVNGTLIGEDFVLNDESVGRLSLWMDSIVPTPAELDEWHDYVGTAIQVHEAADGTKQYTTLSGETLDPSLAESLIDKCSYQHWALTQAEERELDDITRAAYLSGEGPKGSGPKVLSKAASKKFREDPDGEPLAPKISDDFSDLREQQKELRSPAGRWAIAKEASKVELELSKHSNQIVAEQRLQLRQSRTEARLARRDPEIEARADEVRWAVFDRVFAQEERDSLGEFYDFAFRAQDLATEKLVLALQDEAAATGLLPKAMERLEAARKAAGVSKANLDEAVSQVVEDEPKYAKPVAKGDQVDQLRPANFQKLAGKKVVHKLTSGEKEYRVTRLTGNIMPASKRHQFNKEGGHERGIVSRAVRRAAAPVGAAYNKARFNQMAGLKLAEAEVVRIRSDIASAHERVAHFSGSANLTTPDMSAVNSQLERRARTRATQLAQEASTEYRRHLKDGNPEDPTFAQKYFDRYYPPEPAAAVKTMDDLVEQWAEAEAYGDRTTAGDVQDTIELSLTHDTSISDDQKMALIEALSAKKEELKTTKYAPKVAAEAAAKAGPTPQETRFDRITKAQDLLKRWGSRRKADGTIESPAEVTEPEAVKTMDDLVEEWAEAEAFENKDESKKIQDVLEHSLIENPTLSDAQRLAIIEALYSRKEELVSTTYAPRAEAERRRLLGGLATGILAVREQRDLRLF